ncbi:SDR family NAD(P)-dependent oxidoreductase [Desertivirga xinjiangensis]|uniref:SDR family NAD(P)-dependent oxidoreductase n=1 Tax=Desertivirga xinjiangensis TaxID=539206 RepID=UPI00210C9D3A|nr:SDR family oxidoreductase [Pedobacter xinjiangensis]
MLPLQDKVIFLSGGTEGIGYECAKAYLKAGAQLAIVSNSKESLEFAKKSFDNDDILFLAADVAIFDQVNSAISETLETYGRLDVVHNNAGISNPSKRLDETTEEEWQRLFDVNVKGIYNTTKAALSALKKTKGNILNTGSLVGSIGQEIHAAYSATKGAINALTKSMALDYSYFGIRVNAVAPAGVWTPMLRSWSLDQPNSSSIEDYLNNIHPLGYCPEGDVIADACLFLISDNARFITGCILPVSGGAELGYKRNKPIEHQAQTVEKHTCRS